MIELERSRSGDATLKKSDSEYFIVFISLNYRMACLFLPRKREYYQGCIYE